MKYLIQFSGLPRLSSRIRSLLLAGLFLLPYASAQSVECGALLTPDTEVLTSDARIRTAFSAYASDTQINNARRSMSGRFGDISAKDDEVRARAQTRINKVRSDYSQSDYLNYVSNRVPAARTEAFVRCMNPKPLALDLDGTVGTTFTLILHWRDPMTALTISDLRFTPVNLAILNGRLPEILSDKSEYRITLQRIVLTNRSSLDVNAQVLGGPAISAHFEDPGDLPEIPPDSPARIGACLSFIGSSKLLDFYTIVTDARCNRSSGMCAGVESRNTLQLDTLNQTGPLSAEFTGHLVIGGAPISGVLDDGVFTFVETIHSYSEGESAASGKCSDSGMTGTMQTTKSTHYWHTWNLEITKK